MTGDKTYDRTDDTIRSKAAASASSSECANEPRAQKGEPSKEPLPFLYANLSAARRRVCYGLLVLLGFSLGCSEFVVIGIEPELAEAFDCSLARVGDLISWFALSYAIATPLLAIFTSQFRRSSLLAVYLFVFVVGNLVSMVAESFELLLASRVLMGAVAGPLLAVGTTYVPDLLGPKHSSMGISVVYAAFSIALVLATSAGRFIAEYLTWHIAMEGAFAFALITAILLRFIMPKSAHGSDGVASPANQLRLLKEPAVIFGVLIFLFGIGAVYTFYGYVAPYLETTLGLSAAQSGGVLLVFGCICFVSDILSGVIDLRFGMKALPPIFVALAAALFGLWLAGANAALAVAATFVIALLMYSFSIPCITMFMGVARRKHPGALILAASVEPTSFNIGISFGTAAGGLVVTNLGLQAVGLVGGIFALLACACSVAAIVSWRKIRAERALTR